jgi:hypothetical protein
MQRIMSSKRWRFTLKEELVRYLLIMIVHALTALLIAWFSGIQWVLMCWVMAKAGK